MKNQLKSSFQLYRNISAILLLLLVLLGIGYLFITTYNSRLYFQEVNQQLYGGLAEHLVKETKPLVNGKPDTLATHDIMHSMMVINPSVEVYLLNTNGKIIDYVVPFSTVKLEEVDLEPVKHFINKEQNSYITGDDPKNPGVKKVFSAAPIYENEKLTGYAYVILASEEQTTVSNTLFGSYILNSGLKMFAITLAGAMIIGLLAIWLLTRNLRRIIESVRKFKEGDYSARIQQKSKGELEILSQTFNDMADQIVVNIEELKSIDHLRQELIANVSHDLRTPLSIMQGYIETMMMKANTLGPEDRQKYLGIVFDSSQKLAKLISQLFEYSKLEAKQIQPQKEAFFLSELVQDSIARYQILAKEKNIALQMQVAADLPMVFADVGLVERVIQNLVDNALKFTPQEGKISLSLNNTKEGVEVKISDTGPGIPESDQSFIFERYQQSISGEKKSKGAGLGLAIVKKILEIHNVSIQVKSPPNEGTTFWFALPVYQQGLV